MVLFGLFGGKVYKLRKKYDRLRERTDRLRGREIKVQLLKFLDQVEPTIIMLEEKNISRFEKRRMISGVKAELEKAGLMLKQAKEKHRQGEKQQQYQQARQQMQRR